MPFVADDGKRTSLPLERPACATAMNERDGLRSFDTPVPYLYIHRRAVVMPQNDVAGMKDEVAQGRVSLVHVAASDQRLVHRGFTSVHGEPANPANDLTVTELREISTAL